MCLTSKGGNKIKMVIKGHLFRYNVTRDEVKRTPVVILKIYKCKKVLLAEIYFRVKSFLAVTQSSSSSGKNEGQILFKNKNKLITQLY